MHAYLGWADQNGLRDFQLETESARNSLTKNTKLRSDRVAVWMVLDTAASHAIEFLLQSADYREAWNYFQSHSAHFGRLI